MNYFYLTLLLFWSLPGLAQDEYFADQNKEDGLAYYQDILYKGCTIRKKKQSPVSPEEMEKLVKGTIRIVEKNFSQAFNENPKVREAFEKNLTDLSNNPHCQLKSNNCRAQLLSLSMFYYHRLRANVTDCGDCEVEKKYRKRSFEGIQDGSYGTSAAGIYKRAIIEAKNNTTLDLFRLIMHADDTKVHICETPPNGRVYNYALDINEPGTYLEGLDPDYDIRKKIAKVCNEKKKKLFSEFIPTNFDDNRFTVGKDQVGPVVERIVNYMSSNPDEIVTDVQITWTSSKTPYYITVKGKKILDPKSNEKNLSIVKQRAGFTEKVLTELKNKSEYKNINFVTKYSLAGPDFQALDLNDRFVTRMTPGYFQKLEALFKRFEENYQKEALVISYQDLLNEKIYVNLYQAKYKPFHGYRLQYFGYIKSEMRCPGHKPKEAKESSASRQ
ncbi:MAG: hypothetical protein ACLGHN_04595 [Bacteriovoracia bacterium]